MNSRLPGLLTFDSQDGGDLRLQTKLLVLLSALMKQELMTYTETKTFDKAIMEISLCL